MGIKRIECTHTTTPTYLSSEASKRVLNTTSCLGSTTAAGLPRRELLLINGLVVISRCLVAAVVAAAGVVCCYRRRAPLLRCYAGVCAHMLLLLYHAHVRSHQKRLHLNQQQAVFPRDVV